MRGVASEAIIDVVGKGGRLVGGSGGGVGRRVKWYGALARDQA